MRDTYRPPGPNVRGSSLIGLGIRAYLNSRIRLLSNADHWTRNAAGIQLAQLRNLLRTAQHTDFGKKHDFAKLVELPHAEMLAAYRQAVPVADWYAFKDSIARMREGAEPDVLWPGLVHDFAQTSGTTAGDKFIPVSKAMLKSNFLASLDIFSHLHRIGVSLPSLCAGKSLFLGGTTKLDTSPKGIRTGDLSGIVTPLIKWPISTIYLPGPEVALLSHWPTKIEAMAKLCMNQDVRMVSGMCSWALVLFDRMMQLAREQGRKAETLRDIWPNLTVFVHGGVKYAPFDPRIRQAWSGSPDGEDLPRRLELYPASEGFIAMQDTRGDAGLRLLSDIGNFYEFVPLDQIDQPNPPAFTCDQVQKGTRYVVVMSTCAGLWRYIIGDVVEFDSIPAPFGYEGNLDSFAPPRLRIVGRHRHFINAFGENLIVEHIENAVAAAAKASNLIVGEFTAAPIYPTPTTRAGLELAVELDNAHPPDAQLDDFRDAFDASLKSQNVDYTTKRTDGLGMGPPTLTPLPLGTFHQWMQSRGKLGGQHKCPRCANSREIIDQVRSFANLEPARQAPVTISE